MENQKQEKKSEEKEHKEKEKEKKDPFKKLEEKDIKKEEYLKEMEDILIHLQSYILNVLIHKKNDKEEDINIDDFDDLSNLEMDLEMSFTPYDKLVNDVVDDDEKKKKNEEEKKSEVKKDIGDEDDMVHRIACDKCRNNHYENFRYCCKTCFNYDLCEGCFKEKEKFHIKEHEFLKVFMDDVIVDDENLIPFYQGVWKYIKTKKFEESEKAFKETYEKVKEGKYQLKEKIKFGTMVLSTIMLTRRYEEIIDLIQEIYEMVKKYMKDNMKEVENDLTFMGRFYDMYCSCYFTLLIYCGRGLNDEGKALKVFETVYEFAKDYDKDLLEEVYNALRERFTVFENLIYEFRMERLR